jgi:hypothetical protein
MRQATDHETLELLAVSGWDVTANRPRYGIPVSAAGVQLLPDRAAVVDNASRWRIQLGARVNY